MPSALRRRDLPPDPLELFRAWREEFGRTEAREKDAVVLATADEQGRPSARIVLLRGLDERGLCFFTNYDSRKGRELQQNPRAALLFYFDALARQVRVEGPVERTRTEESAAYFRNRPRGSQLGAWTSRQSRPVANREELEREWAAREEEYRGRDVPLPPFWGGFRLRPERWEFWMSRESRLHDRFVYDEADEGWTLTRLAP